MIEKNCTGSQTIIRKIHVCLLSTLLLTGFLFARENPAPAIQPGGGSFSEPVEVTLSTTIPGAEIHYTTDFYQNPTQASPRYNKPFILDSKATVKAVVFKDGVAISNKSVAHFTFFKPEVMAAIYDWKPQPEKAALMIVFAHPDDEVIPFRGTIPYYATVKQLPIVVICMANSDKVKKDRMRRKELECALWTYGLRNKPLYANFPDDCYNRPISCCLDSWGLDNATRYITEQIRKYKPEVILTHDLSGEYGAPNHIVTAMATFDAYLSAADPAKYPQQLTDLLVWQPKKLYAHLCLQNSWQHDWDTPYPELGGKSPQQVAAQGVECHFSQKAHFVDYQGRIFGLLRSQVGPDEIKQDFFENIDTSR